MIDHPAIIWGTRTIHYSRLEQYIASVTKHLKSRGIATADRVAIVDHNSIEYVVVLLALWKMGVVACPINPKWPLETLIETVRILNPKLVLTNHNQALAHKKLSIPIAELRELISYDARHAHEIVSHDIPIEQISTIVWTSGSSASPKAAVHSWGNHFYSAKGSQEVLPLKEGDRWVLSLPLYHVSGISIVCRCYLAKAAIVLCLDEDDISQGILRSKATHLSLVSTQLYRMLDNKDHHPSLKALRYILLGGSTIPSSLLEKALFLGLPIYVSYGLTEGTSQIATGKVEDIHKPCAKILPYRQLRINQDGQILIKGEVLFKGYLIQNKLSLPLTEDGWFKTGDLGKWQDGCLAVLGRKDNMFISAGENIQPEEIENVLLRLFSVKQAVVIPKDDPEYGARPIAFVRMQGVFNESILRSQCVQYLPKIKVPVAFYPWPQELHQGIKISRKFFQERLGNLEAG